MGGKAVHVGSGSFRVSRERALEKLGRFQLQDRWSFPALWVRCAVASEASKIVLSGTLYQIHLRFDGKPLSRQELADPFACLFDPETPHASRLKELAWGLLAARAFKSADILVVSGEGAGRHGLRLRPDGSTELEPDRGSGAGTVIAATWNEKVPWSASMRREDLFTLCPAEVWVNGKIARPAALPGVAFQTDGIRGRLSPPEVGRSALYKEWSAIKLYRHGVLAGHAAARSEPAEFRAWVNDDELALDASLAAAAGGERHKRLVAQVEAQAEKLLLWAVEEQKKTFPRLARLMRLHGHWKLWAAPGPARKASLGEPVKAGLGKLLLDELRGRKTGLGERDRRAAELARCAWLTEWLRGAARKLLGGSKQAALEAVWDAPLFLAPLRGVRTPRQLLLYHDAKLPIRATFQGPKSPWHRAADVWCPAPRDAWWLEEFRKAMFRRRQKSHG